MLNLYYLMLRVAILTILTIMAGCQVHTEQLADGTRIDHYLGYTRVVYPVVESSQPNLDVKKVENFGLGFNDGLMLGYSSRKQVSLPPGNGLYLDNLPERHFETFSDLISQSNLQDTQWIIEKQTKEP